MPTMMKNVLGLDIGSHSIKAVELRQTLRGLEPVQLRVDPRGDNADPLPESLQRFIRMHQFSTAHLTCALPGDRVSTRLLEFPFRDRKRLAQAVPYAVEGETPFDLEDVMVDWQLVGGDRGRAEVATTIAQKSDVSRILEELSQAGCQPRILEAEGLVLGGLASLFDLAGTRLLVDLGHRKTTLCLLLNEQPVAARAIPIGGLALTQAIARDRGLDLEQAERLKCEEGIFRGDWSSLSQGAVEHLDRIAREIVRSLESLEHRLGGPASTCVDQITLVGGGARLHRVDEYLAQRVGIATARLALPDDPEGAALVAGGDPLLFAPATALALRDTAHAATRMNFRQDEFAYRTDLSRLFSRELRPTAILAGITTLLLGSSTATSIAVESRRADRLEARAAELYTATLPGQSLPASPVTSLGQAVREARDRADFLGLYGGSLSALDLMTQLSERVPTDLKIKFEEVNIDREVIRVKVAAENYEAQDRLENELKAEPPFTRADVSGKSTRLKDGSITFSISIPLHSAEDDE